MSRKIDAKQVEKCMSFLEKYIGDNGISIAPLVEMYLFELSKLYNVGEGILIEGLKEAKRQQFNEIFLTNFISNYKPQPVVKRQWTLYFPLNIHLKKVIKFKVLNQQVIIYAPGYPKKIRRKLDNHFFQLYMPSGFPLPNLQCSLFSLDIYAADIEEATKLASKYLTVFRSSFEMLNTGSKVSWLASNFVKESITRWPFWLVYQDDKDEVKGGFFVIHPPLNDNINEVKNNSIVESIKLIRDIERCSDNYRDYLFHLFDLWLRARDSDFEHDALLSYWQCLELITLADQNHGNTEKIIDRTSMLLRVSGLDIIPRETLKFFAKQRNLFVHESEYEPNYSLKHLNYIIFGCIRFLFEQRKIFKNKNDLNAFYESCKIIYNPEYNAEFVTKKVIEFKRTKN